MIKLKVQKKNLTIEESFNLATQNHKEKKFKVAEYHYKEILKNKPDHFQSNFLLGTLAAQTKKFNIAKELFEKTIQIDPNYADTYNNLGNVQRELGENHKAIISYEKAIKINPNYAQAHNNLGVTNRKLGKLQNAKKNYEKAIQINFNFADAHNNLGNIQKVLGNHQQAQKCYEKAIQLNPRHADAHNNFGTLLFEVREIEKAKKYFEKTIQIDPNYSQAYYNLMEISERTHNVDLLHKYIKNATLLFGNNPIINIFKTLVLLRKNKYNEAKTLLESDDIDKYHSIPMEYKIKYYELLSKVYDQLNETKKSFKYFLKINEHDSKNVINQNYNKDLWFNELGINREYFQLKNISKWRKIDIPNIRSSPIFLIGFPRSGTTLLDTIFRSHPLIEVIEEKFMVNEMKSYFNKFSNEKIELLNDISDDQLKKIRDIYYEKIDLFISKDIQKNKIIIDKLPLNIIEAGFIHRIFPESKFIFCLRHPCDSVLSCFMNRFKMNNAMAIFTNISDTISFYDQVMSLWIQYISKLPIKFKTIKYENLIENLEDSIKPLLNFLNLEWNNSMLGFNQTALERTKINTPSYNQVIKPLYTQAIGRWKRYEDDIKIYPKLTKWIKEFDY